MLNPLIQAAIVAAWLGAPVLAADTGLGPALPSETTAQEERKAAEQERMRESPAPSRRAPVRPAPGVEPGVQPPVEPGVQPPSEEVQVPEAGRRWGLILFVVAIVALGIMAFRRRPPMPPSR